MATHIKTHSALSRKRLSGPLDPPPGDWSLCHYDQTISHYYIARSQTLLEEIEFRSGKGH